MMFKVPHEIPEVLGLPNPTFYTFHSFRRTSGTIAADAGSTTDGGLLWMEEFFDVPRVHFIK